MNNEQFKVLVEERIAEKKARKAKAREADTRTPEELAQARAAKAERNRKFAALARKRKAEAAARGESVGTDGAATEEYRDRAAERRRGDAAVYDDAALIDNSRFTVEESKHLGGDLAHTHLVKGLDFQLLRKVRARAGAAGAGAAGAAWSGRR